MLRAGKYRLNAVTARVLDVVGIIALLDLTCSVFLQEQLDGDPSGDSLHRSQVIFDGHICED